MERVPGPHGSQGQQILALGHFRTLLDTAEELRTGGAPQEWLSLSQGRREKGREERTLSGYHRDESVLGLLGWAAWVGGHA